MSNKRHWRRWVHASISAYLKAAADNENIPSLVEGIEDRDEQFMQSQDRVEIRVNGPYTRNPSGSYHWARVFINVLATSNFGGNTRNRYKLDDNLGIMYEAMCNPIPIFDCPDTNVIGCLKVLDTFGVRINDFGQIDQTDKVRQGMVSGAYYIELTDNCD